MKIVIQPHTLQRAGERGATESEIRDCLMHGMETNGRAGRKVRAIVLPFEAERLGKWYRQKRIEVVYATENEIMHTITVYVFYGEWS